MDFEIAATGDRQRMSDQGPLLRRTLALVAQQAWVQKAASSTPVLRDIAWRFVAGEDLAAGLAVVRDLNARGVLGSLNYLGTHVRDEAACLAATDAIIETLRGVRLAELHAHVSVKLTQIGLDLDPQFCRTQLRRVLGTAQESAVFVRVDMEESQYVDDTISLFEQMRDEFGADAVGIVVQSYLRHRHGDLKRLLAGGSRVRLVKGGYWQSPEIVYRSKVDVDQAFLADIDRLMSRGTQPAIATHDERAVDRVREVAKGIGLDRQAYEFQMLYGVRTDLRAQLTREGYRVRCYVPFGASWYSYVLGCLRRSPAWAMRGLRSRHHARRG